MREIDDPMKSSIAAGILGTDSFIDKIRRALTDISENLNLRRELGAKAKLLSSADIETVADAVCKSYKVEKNCILTKNSRNNEARQVLLYLACKFCRGRYSLSELGSRLGALTVGAMTRSRYNVSAKIKNSIKLKRKIEEIESYIVNS